MTDWTLLRVRLIWLMPMTGNPNMSLFRLLMGTPLENYSGSDSVWRAFEFKEVCQDLGALLFDPDSLEIRETTVAGNVWIRGPISTKSRRPGSTWGEIYVAATEDAEKLYLPFCGKLP